MKSTSGHFTVGSTVQKNPKVMSDETGQKVNFHVYYSKSSVLILCSVQRMCKYIYSDTSK